MSILKHQIARLIEKNASARVATLANRYPHARPAEREEIMAGIEIERWLAQACRECLE